MLLNAHSTTAMARLGRVVGNTRTAVQPGNLQLIGRATWLIQSHGNGVLDSAAWRARHGDTAALDYTEANAVLFEAIAQRSTLADAAQLPEVEVGGGDPGEPGAAAADRLPGAQRLRAQGLNGYLQAQTR
ncbi:hypothetical protein [Xanthomonas theicola]|uniref:Uncharacterized protein n=1 Tax=Xanthomonas theicola TaxID=56464 RepID=A0A2S6ZF02_9XANT|nr:hypothetical protein [Xanthomonas theicola]PPT90864.1 hypothetical protein XthCFBP4691_10315 [Xanthomonas theicola]QNH26645.1 hypothetical protein G4Q83_20660 [Xanthomonas theicola]